MHQIAMRGMQFDQLQAQALGTLCRCDEGVNHSIDPRLIQRLWRRLPCAKRHRRCGHGLPAMRMIGCDGLAAFPRQIGRRLAAGMRQLDADRHRRPASYRLQYLGQGLLGRIVVQTKIGVTDAPFRHHRSRFENQQSGTGLRQRAQVDAMPIGGAAVLCRVLAHRRNDNPVGERERTEGDGREQLAQSGIHS